MWRLVATPKLHGEYSVDLWRFGQENNANIGRRASSTSFEVYFKKSLNGVCHAFSLSKSVTEFIK